MLFSVYAENDWGNDGMVVLVTLQNSYIKSGCVCVLIIYCIGLEKARTRMRQFAGERSQPLLKSRCMLQRSAFSVIYDL